MIDTSRDQWAYTEVLLTVAAPANSKRPSLVGYLKSLFVPQKTRLPVIQALRGVAAMTVCWCHLTWGLPEYRHTLLGASGHYGYLGVNVFFVLSGFIVPYAMYTAGYRLANLWTFLAKRMIRVEPPYLISIAISILMWIGATWSPLYKGGEPRYGATQLALHLGYLMPFFPKYKWISGVYWSLAVEFQYYLAISIFFPLLFSRKLGIRMTSCLLFAASALVLPQDRFLPKFAPLFVLGFLGMLRMVGLASWRELFFVGTICAVIAVQAQWVYVVITGVATLAVILSVQRSPAFLLWLGDISYSLYLIHDMVGRRVVHVAARFIPNGAKVLLPICAVLVSILCALAMFRLIELPAKRMAAKFRYRSDMAPRACSGM